MSIRRLHERLPLGVTILLGAAEGKGEEEEKHFKVDYPTRRGVLQLLFNKLLYIMHCLTVGGLVSSITLYAPTALKGQGVVQ